MSSHPLARPTRLHEDLAAYRLLTSDEAALVLCVPVATLRMWRSRRGGYGPRALQVGGGIRYRMADLLAWIDDHTETDVGGLAEGIEPSRRGKASPADLRSLMRRRRPARVAPDGSCTDNPTR